MPLWNAAEITWEELRDHVCPDSVAILPVGAHEAHGPHLPLCTDVVIAEAMARRGGERLAAAGKSVFLLPALPFTAAPFAAGFAGTVSIRPELVTGLVCDIATSLSRHGIGYLALANAHLDPTHIASLHAAVSEANATARSARIIYPDITRRPWGSRLTDEFKSGACHAGCYEGSVVLSERPDLVRVELMRALPPNPRSLSDAIAAGLVSFEAAGGPRAYFGEPAASSASEGLSTIDILGQILEEAVVQTVTGGGAAAPGA